MPTTTVEVPDDLLSLLEQSRLGARPLRQQVQIALVIQLFQEGVISIGKAAELAGENRLSFESLLVDMGIPPARSDVADYEQDMEAIRGASRPGPPPE